MLLIQYQLERFKQEIARKLCTALYFESRICWDSRNPRYQCHQGPTTIEDNFIKIL